MDEQLELPLEWPKYAQYSIEVRVNCNTPSETVVRSHKAENAEDARNLIEGLRDVYAGRDDVIWQDDEVGPNGKLWGLAPYGVVWLIEVTPSLTTPLTPA